MHQQECVSYEVPGTASPGWGAIRRSVLKDLLPPGLPTHDGSGKFALTSYENFIHATETFPDKPCLGYRPIASDGSAGPFKWSTYKKVLSEVEDFSGGILSLDLCPPSTGDKELHDRGVLGIMMRNRPEWFIAEQACFFHSLIPVPLYDTAKADTVGTILERISSLRTIVCSSLTIKELIHMKKTYPSVGLTTLVCCDEMDAGTIASASAVGLKCYRFEEVLFAGARGPRVPHRPPSPDDIYTFCFTSGTTGEPKGALISHRGLIANAVSIAERTRTFAVGDESTLSFLPLPHMFERVSQLLVVCAGGKIGFFQGDPLKLVDDLIELRPTRFVAVPRVLSRMREKVESSIRESGGVTQRLFNYAMRRGMRLVKERPAGELDTVSSALDGLLFRKIRAKLGLDNVRQILTGSAPIAPETLFWLRVVFGTTPVNEGYGQTECTLVCSIQGVAEVSAGDCGGPLTCCDVRLMDVPEMGYRSSDREHGRNDEVIRCAGRGEICIRGDNVFRGYYKMADKTAETVDANGWLHTGDIGLWTVSGQLKIIDRKKNIFKLSQGEYVAPEKIEAIFSTSKFVLQSLVYGDSVRDHLVAIIVPNPDMIKEWVGKQSNGILKNLPLVELCKSSELNTVILNELTAKSRQAKLNGYEIVKTIHLEPEMWTPDTLLTPTFKLKRKDAEIKYKTVIDRMYETYTGNSKL
jgi:long-chain acyl-CoA synthetase